MQKNLKCEETGSVLNRSLESRTMKMDYDGVLISERMKEVMGVCERNHPVYEQISSFSVALYALGFFDCRDFMSLQDISADQAVEILQTDFWEIKFDEIPDDYQIFNSKERYLLVIGDPLFPIHFAVLTDLSSPSPYFSKLPFFGAGFDSMKELIKDFVGMEGIAADDFHFFLEKASRPNPAIIKRKNLYC